MSIIGDRIRSRRDELKWTQEQLAKKADISTGFLSDVERGKRGISADNLFDIAHALGVSLDFLMSGEEPTEEIREIEIPARLTELASKEHLSFKTVLTLLDLRQQVRAHRSEGITRRDDFDWRKFYEAVKDYLPK